MKILWLLLAGGCGVVAAIFLLNKDYDKAFVIAAAGAVCWFLSYRAQIKKLVDSRAESEEDEERNDDED